MPQPPKKLKSQAEPATEQLASFILFFIHILVLKGFLLPLFIIPTGSMAATLNGAHVDVACPNCGWEYATGVADVGPVQNQLTACPNCRWAQVTPNVDVRLRQQLRPDERLDELNVKSGDRIIVHGWPYDLGGMFAPQRWDVCVFKVPNDGQTNYIKRLIGRPNEKIEIIDGDVFVDDRIARKEGPARDALWIPYYDHDFPPQEPSNLPKFYANAGPQAAALLEYQPRWEALAGSAWRDVATRRPRFDGGGSGPGTMQFVTTVRAAQEAAFVTNYYGYNEPGDKMLMIESDLVLDLRIRAELAFADARPDGFVEFELGRYGKSFFARIYADGRVTLEHAAAGGARETWQALPAGEVATGRPVQVALGVADERAQVEVNGRVVLQSTDEQFDVTPAEAVARRVNKRPPTIRVAAAAASVELAHLAIDRDVYYTDKPAGSNWADFTGGAGRPIQLGPAEYFVCGDNSPASLDSRMWRPEQLGPHLRGAYGAGEYQLGTVPADQMIGPAFFVYWPGFNSLFPGASRVRVMGFRVLNILPDAGRIRWIH